MRRCRFVSYSTQPLSARSPSVWRSGALANADMTVETAPVISVYLGSKAGRAPKKARNDHRLHASVDIIAHKSSEYVCNSDFADRKLRSSAPKVGARLPELDAIGVVVSANHPPKSTYLAPAVAEYCVARSVWHMRLRNVRFYEVHGFPFVYLLITITRLSACNFIITTVSSILHMSSSGICILLRY